MMTSRERLLAALNHKEADCVPLDIGSTHVTGITLTALRKYMSYKSINTGDIEVEDLIQQLAVVPTDLLNMWGVDTRYVSPQSDGFEIKMFMDGEYNCFFDEWGIGWRKPEKGLYYDMHYNPLAGIEAVEELKKLKWPVSNSSLRFKGMREAALRLIDQGYALVAGNMAAGFTELTGWLRGYENWYCDLAINKIFAHELIEKTIELQYNYVERLLNEIGDILDVYVDKEDSGGQNAPLMSKDMYREFVIPGMKKIYGLVKSKSKAKVFVHTCGSVYDLIPDLIDAGVDILNPVQVSAAKMEPKILKKEFGKDLVFWGAGIDTQKILPNGSVEEVKDNVKFMMDTFTPGGGFVFASIHNIQGDVPPENIEAMVQAFELHKKY